MQDADADAIPFVHKRPKVTTAQYTEIVQSENDIELTEENNSMNMNKSHPSKEIEEEETENILQEQDKTQNNKQSQPNIDTNPNVTTESKMESTHINTEIQKQHEQSKDLVLDERDKQVKKSSKTSEKVQKLSQEDQSEWESFDDDVLNSLTLFQEVNSSN